VLGLALLGRNRISNLSLVHCKHSIKNSKVLERIEDTWPVHPSPKEN